MNILKKLKIKKCKKIQDKLTFLCISDTHGQLLNEKNELIQQLKIELQDQLDAVICLGDIRKDELKIICDLNNNKHIILGIKGNHDELDQFDSFPDIIDIHANIFKINNTKIIGLEGSIKYKNYDYPAFTQEESIKLISNFEKDANILITHSHLYNENEKLDKYNSHVGLMGSTQYFLENRCSINLHGHDHKKSSEETKHLKNNSTSIGIYLIEKIEI